MDYLATTIDRVDTLGIRERGSGYVFTAVAETNFMTSLSRRVAPYAGVGVGVDAVGTTISNEQIAIVGPVLPTAPTGLTAQVAGRSVTLNWTAPPGGVTGYVLEAGASPGATQLSQAIGSTASSLTVNDVPPGTYYVRIRARNGAGTGPASNEVVVVVP